ncbi:hypothetical protein BDN70DRAFT_877784 [Pholiota conissans]|uniref:Uncharacterized protein n=1 Tax=Pholiota conissans TaxID=109636 RepID=A0A9P5Z2L3_9AGAR|nr:hypothetical protein BDN70DRAFT_877784 [Pholiota conissans]
MSTTSFLLPSHFDSPFLTTISDIKYDSKGRQMSYTETEVQRLERVAFINASKSRSSSPVDSLNSANSSPTSQTRKLIAEPYDPIELMANRLAAELMFGIDDFSSSSDEEQQIIYSTPKTTQRAPAVSFAPSPKVPSTFTPGHRRKRSSLSSIPEED